MSNGTTRKIEVARERFSFDESQGQLFVSVKEIRGLRSEGLTAFCILQLDKQQVKTRGVQQLGDPELSGTWNEGFTFDVTNLNTQLVVSVLGTSQITVGDEPIDNREGKFLGHLVIPVVALAHQKPVDQWFKLAWNDPKEVSDRGEAHVKLQYTATTTQVGVSSFKPLLVVGKGTFAKVMMVQKVDTGRLYAMKVINKDAVIQHNAVKHTMSERNVLKKINHPFIVSLKFSFQTQDKLYMILDYINGGELFYHLSDAERFNQERTRFYTAEITLALGYLHSLDIVYRDLKPENLLLDMNGHICLTDFGLVKENLGFGSVTHTFCGSPEYLAPEIFTPNGYDKSVDWWAMGTLMYEMLSGLPPFFSDDLEEMNERILNETLTFPNYFSTEAKSLLLLLLERDPKKRLGSGPKDYQEIISHPFFDGIDWDRLSERAVDPPFRPALRGETDVRFFDPESTMMQAKHSFSECHLTNKEQEAFRGFSYVAPDADLRYMARRRGSSGASRGNSTNNSPTVSPIPSLRRTSSSTAAPPRPIDLASFENKEKKDFLSQHRALESMHIYGEYDGYSSDPSFDGSDDEVSLSKTSWRPVLPKSLSSPILVKQKANSSSY